MFKTKFEEFIPSIQIIILLGVQTADSIINRIKLALIEFYNLLTVNRIENFFNKN